jgi:mono/diheme cytochrome c family protein
MPMRWRTGTAVAAVVWLAASVSGPLDVAPVRVAAQVSPSAPTLTPQRALLDKYCLTCHTAAAKSRGAVPVALDGLNLTDIGADAAVWEQAVRKMRAGLMPPAGAPRPDKAAHDDLATWLERELDAHAARHPNPGRTEPLHRLNRTEYRNAIRDLLDLEIDVAALLPPDDSSYGFDNIAGVLKLSPTLMERYLNAAQKVSRVAVGTPPPSPNIDYYRVPDDLAQDVHLPGMPLGTRGGTRIRYTFPVDGEYEVRVRLARDLNESVPVYTTAQQVEVSIDGVRAGIFTLPGAGTAAPPPRLAPAGDSPEAERPQISQIQQTVRVTAKEREARNKADESWNLRVPIEAGPRDVVVTFINRTAALDETTRLPFLRPYPAGVNIPETRLGAHLRSVEIAGPYDPRGADEAPSRRRVFTCQPGQPAPPASSAAGSAGGEAACARTILSTLARRAYRRPVADTDVEPLLAFYREGRDSGGFDAGIERALRRLLVSPEFLFRVERDPAGAIAGRAYPVDDVALASRLSFFLWSSIPDDELLGLAERGRLSDPQVLTQQAERLLADPRAAAFVTSFAGQWLFLRNLAATVPVQSLFPDFDDTLRQAFRTETEMFFESIVREDRSALDLLRADYTFLNERLARHYGVANVKGSHFRRVPLPEDSVRAGLLGHGSILTVTSYPDRTSPVVRGKWILENLLGTPPPPPIPNVGELRPTDGAGVVLSMRERMEQHRRNPVCASCHSMMDPLGLSLENFDAVGRWRTLGESATRIDASGILPDGTRFEGPDGLRSALLQSDRFVPTVTEKLLTYALGRGLEHYDAAAVRTIVRDARRDDYRFSSLIAGVVRSAPFRMRTAG